MYGRYFFGCQLPMGPVMLPLRFWSWGSELEGATDRTSGGHFNRGAMDELMAHTASPYIIAVI